MSLAVLAPPTPETVADLLEALGDIPPGASGCIPRREPPRKTT